MILAFPALRTKVIVIKATINTIAVSIIIDKLLTDLIVALAWLLHTAALRNLVDTID